MDTKRLSAEVSALIQSSGEARQTKVTAVPLLDGETFEQAMHRREQTARRIRAAIEARMMKAEE